MCNLSTTLLVLCVPFKLSQTTMVFGGECLKMKNGMVLAMIGRGPLRRGLFSKPRVQPHTFVILTVQIILMLPLGGRQILLELYGRLLDFQILQQRMLLSVLKFTYEQNMATINFQLFLHHQTRACLPWKKKHGLVMWLKVNQCV